MKGDLISRSALLKAIENAESDVPFFVDIDEVISLISDATAEDATPVVHGRWVQSTVNAWNTAFVCSACGREIEVGNDYLYKPSAYASEVFPYCHCGAKMDKE